MSHPDQQGAGWMVANLPLPTLRPPRRFGYGALDFVGQPPQMFGQPVKHFALGRVGREIAD